MARANLEGEELVLFFGWIRACFVGEPWVYNHKHFYEYQKGLMKFGVQGSGGEPSCKKMAMVGCILDLYYKRK